MISESVFNGAYKNQLLAVLTANILSLSHGVCVGWVSPSLATLQSEQSPIGAISVEDGSWIGSLISFGTVIGLLAYMYVGNAFGRKKALVLLPFPQIACWATVYFASNVNHLCIARFCAGLSGGGLYATLPIYVSEIADNKIRGRLASIFTLSISIGTVIGFSIAAYLDFFLSPCIAVAFPILYLFGILFFSETPQYLLQTGQIEQAEKAMKFYRNFKALDLASGEAKQFYAEFNEMKKIVEESSSRNEETLRWRDLCDKELISALLIAFGLNMLFVFSGIYAILNYSANIFAASGSKIDPNTSTIILGVIQILGTYTAAILVDKYGRKILLTISSFGTSVGLLLSGLFVYYSTQYDLSEYSWVPIATMSWVIFIASIGILSVCFVVVVEVLPMKIRSGGTLFCFLMGNMLLFTLLKIFPILLVNIGYHGLMWFCAFFSGIGTIFVITCVSETKGISLDRSAQKA